MSVAGSKQRGEDQASIEEMLLNFQKEQEQALGLDQQKASQWFDPVPRQFLAKDKAFSMGA